MIEVRTTDVFTRWFNRLRDRRARARIQARIDRLVFGSILSSVALLLSGGDKRTQSADIERAKVLALQIDTGESMPNE